MRPIMGGIAVVAAIGMTTGVWVSMSPPAQAAGERIECGSVTLTGDKLTATGCFQEGIGASAKNVIIEHNTDGEGIVRYKCDKVEKKSISTLAGTSCKRK
jgi:hypothetical protein